MAKLVLTWKETEILEIDFDKQQGVFGLLSDNSKETNKSTASGRYVKIFREHNAFVIEGQESLLDSSSHSEHLTLRTISNGHRIFFGEHALEFIEPQLNSAVPAAAGSQSFTAQTAEADAFSATTMQQQTELSPNIDRPGGVSRDSDRNAVLGGFIVIEGTAEKREFKLIDRVTAIGKDSSAAIRLRGFFTPKVVALVNRRKEGYFISPTAKNKLPKVNGITINDRCNLNDGDIVEVPGLTMQFYLIK
jgi:hypothetical protein